MPFYGNSVVIKPSELAPSTSRVLKELIDSVFPMNIVTVVEGDADVAKYLLDKKSGLYIFTGSTRMKDYRRKSCKNSCNNMTELGGKSPCMVIQVNIDKVAKRIVSGKFVNCGQTCIAPDYIVVNQHIKSKLVSAIKENIIKTFGNSPIDSENYGRIINIDNLNRIKNVLKNQKVEFGGKISSDRLYIEPTIIIDPDMNSEIMNEEIFGPILPILSYENESEIKDIIDNNPTPLAFYIFSKNQTFIDNLIENNKFGMCSQRYSNTLY